MEYGEGCHIKHIYENLTTKEVEQAIITLAEIQAVMDQVPEKQRAEFGVSAYEELYADILSPDVSKSLLAYESM